MSAEGDGPNRRPDRDQGNGAASNKPSRQDSSEDGSGKRREAQERGTGSSARRFDPQHRVPWRDATLTARTRQDWRAFYATVGASLRSIPDARFAGLSNCWVARTERSSVRRPDTGERLVVETMRKLLARGTAPPLHPDAERDLLKARGLGSRIVEADAAGDVDPPTSLTSSDFAVPGGGEIVFDYGLARGDSNSSDLAQMTESNREREFVEWVAEQAPASLRWLTPQPALDLLLAAAGGTWRLGDPDGQRRCDFLFSPPGAQPVVFEVDGGQHEEQKAEDLNRDRLLRNIRIETIRIPTSELDEGAGWGLRAVDEALQRHPGLATEEIEPLVWAPIQVHRLVLGVCEAIDAGWLTGNRWHVEVRDPTGLAIDLVEPYLGLLDALDCLWGNRATAPSRVEFVCGDQQLVYVRMATGRYEAAEVTRPLSEQGDVRIFLDCDRTPCEPLPEDHEIPAVVIPSTGVPVLVSDNPTGPLTRIEPFASCDSDEDRRAALEAVMRAVFAKPELREGQFEALTEVLAGQDCAVLLPTGAGKSMIYQLAGLCLPGSTLVVDPLVALMEDQIHGLRMHGIDRAAGISSRTRDLPREPGDAYFIFVTPERLQRQKFRNELAAAAQTTPVNLAVIDEAHCVSEWGHDFRPAYLNFGMTLRGACNGALGEPPLLALTGTASRAVLKDVLFHLGIRQANENSIVRPSTFDRPELSYRVVLATPDDSEARLQGELRAMSGHFGAVAATFFEPTGRLDTYSGIVFVPTVKGRGWHNVTETWEQVRARVPSAVRYSGSAPEGVDGRGWDREKSVAAADFKDNRAAAIVTTKAFGMGIDKPNIRWIVHYGLPGSVEAFYQEVGRAGRDGHEARSVLILTERDRERNGQRLWRDGRTGSGTGGSGRRNRDDVATALYFHDGSFPAKEAEHRRLLQIFDTLEADDRRVILAADGGSRDAGKRALHRLAMLSVVDDYCLEGQGRSEVAVVRCRERAPSDIVEGLLGLVGRSDPGRREAMRAEADIQYSTLRAAVDRCGRMLIDFVYDTIEGARRRSLREMWLAAGDAESDGGIMRERILGYLTEGDIARRVQELAEHRFAFSDWTHAWTATAVQIDEGEGPSGDSSPEDVAGILVSEGDTREWRSATARLLTSYPDHPGLLASRGLAEAMLPDGDTREFEQHLEQSLFRARDNYGVDESEVEQLILWLLQLFSTNVGDGTLHSMGRPAIERAGKEPADLAANVIATGQRAGVATGAVEDWLDANWHAGAQLAVLRLAKSLESASELALTATIRYRRGNHGRA